MKTIDKTQLAKAEHFIWLSARVLERVRFEHLFKGGPREPVLMALRAYQNPDGGFGQAIEPDFRGPVSQPLGVDFAFKILEEIELPDEAVIQAALGFLTKITAPDRGLPNTLPNVADYPRAPWWGVPDKVVGCILPTGAVVASLLQWRIGHPWVEGAISYCWPAIDALIERAKVAEGHRARIQITYEARAAVQFLDRAPDRARAEEVATALHDALERAGMIERQVAPAVEIGLPLDFAPHPDSVARRWFDDTVIEKHLDAMVAAQGNDGGWTVPWPIWTPITEYEWRGVLTVERLRTLRAYGRFASG
jgi:hypothetical protein